MSRHDDRPATVWKPWDNPESIPTRADPCFHADATAEKNDFGPTEKRRSVLTAPKQFFDIGVTCQSPRNNSPSR